MCCCVSCISRSRSIDSNVDESLFVCVPVKPPAKPEGLQEELSGAAVGAPALQEAPQQELQVASSWRPPAGGHVTSGDAEVLYDDVPAEAGPRTLDSDRGESSSPAAPHWGSNNSILLTRRLVPLMVPLGSRRRRRPLRGRSAVQ